MPRFGGKVVHSESAGVLAEPYEGGVGPRRDQRPARGEVDGPTLFMH